MRRAPILFVALFAALAPLSVGCGDEQRAACAEYVACIDARDAALGYETDVVRFDVGGDCWGSDLGADLCETACVQGLAFLRDREPNRPAECG